jgi:signal transduction histidine kinase
MRAHAQFKARPGGLIDSYAAKFAEATAVRRAAVEARAARAEAELSIRARSEFLANMNHELRTPLNAVIGFATMLRDGESYALSDEQRRSYAEYILQSADLLLAHINTLLEIAALDGGQVALAKSDVDVARLLAEAVDRVQTAAQAAEVAVELRGAITGVFACGDETRIGQAFDHLLRTAVRTSRKGGKVLARAVAASDGWAEIAVRDAGEGLSPEAIAHALSVFDEVHRGLDRSFAGPGVGLAIAKAFVEMQGGRFDIKSRLGEGTIARLYLPPAHSQSTAVQEPLRKAS